MRRLRLLAIGLAVLASIQGAYVVGRTVQVVREELRRDDPGARVPEGVWGPRTDLEWQAYGRQNPGLEAAGCRDSLDPSVDHDGDGLSGREEARQLTSDRFPDSDGDGVSDPDDHSPNGVAPSYRERVESSAVSDILRAWSKEGTVYVVVDHGQYLDIDSPTGTNIVISEASFAYLMVTEDILPLVRCGDDGSVRAYDRIFVPGLLYVYTIDQWFGGVCGAGDLVFLIDLPFVGPVPVHRVTLWVS